MLAGEGAGEPGELGTHGLRPVGVQQWPEGVQRSADPPCGTPERADRLRGLLGGAAAPGSALPVGPQRAEELGGLRLEVGGERVPAGGAARVRCSGAGCERRAPGSAAGCPGGCCRSPVRVTVRGRGHPGTADGSKAGGGGRPGRPAGRGPPRRSGGEDGRRGVRRRSGGEGRRGVRCRCGGEGRRGVRRLCGGGGRRGVCCRSGGEGRRGVRCRCGGEGRRGVRRRCGGEDSRGVRRRCGGAPAGGGAPLRGAAHRRRRLARPLARRAVTGHAVTGRLPARHAPEAGSRAGREQPSGRAGRCASDGRCRNGPVGRGWDARVGRSRPVGRGRNARVGRGLRWARAGRGRTADGARGGTPGRDRPGGRPVVGRDARCRRVRVLLCHAGASGRL